HGRLVLAATLARLAAGFLAAAAGRLARRRAARGRDHLALERAWILRLGPRQRRVVVVKAPRAGRRPFHGADGLEDLVGHALLQIAHRAVAHDDVGATVAVGLGGQERLQAVLLGHGAD